MRTLGEDRIGLDGNDRLITVSDAKAAVGISRSKIYQLVSEGCFPRPTKVGARSLFSEREIQAWISARLGSRENTVARSPAGPPIPPSQTVEGQE